jgi:hypothetical protein
MAKKIMKDEFDAVKDAQSLREMSDDPIVAKRAMDQVNKTAQALKNIKAGKIEAPTSDDMGPLRKVRPVKMPELKTKDTGDKNSFDIKGEKMPGYEDSEPVKMPSFKKGGSVSSASKRADGIAIRGKTRA